MFSVTHFRSEFIRQNQATIIRKVTMTQFMMVIILTAIGVGVFHAPLWLAPIFIVAGYAAGYSHHGEIILKRVVAYSTVWLRNMIGSPQIINIQSEWDNVRVQAERQHVNGTLSATIIVE